MVELLIKNGADPNATDARVKTPLHLAVSAKSIEVVKVLLQHHADPNITDDKVTLCGKSKVLKITSLEVDHHFIFQLATPLLLS